MEYASDGGPSISAPRHSPLRSMTDVDFDSLASDLNDGAGNGGSSTDTDDYEYDDAPVLKATPQVALGFDGILEIGILGGVNEEQNIRKANGMPNSASIVLENPTVLDGTLWRATSEDESSDYKLVDMDYDEVGVNFEEVDGEPQQTGVKTYGREFESEEVEDFEEDVVRVFAGSGVGQHLLQTLDAAGAVAANESEDETAVEGLIEYPDEYGTDGYNPEDHGYPRIARVPTLRDDIDDGVLFFYLSDETYNGNHMHRVDVFDGEVDPDNVVEPTDRVEEVDTDDLYSYLAWPDSSGEASTSTNTSTDDATDDIDFDEGFGDDDDEAESVSGYDDLTDTQKGFVDKCVDEGVHGDDGSRTMEEFQDTIDAYVDQGMEALDAEDATEIIKARV